MLAPTLITLPAEILSHIFSYLVFKDITIVPPTQSLLPYYQPIVYNSVFIVSLLAYNSFSATLRAKPFLAKLIIKFDIDFRDRNFQRSIWALDLVNHIKMMSQLRWLGLAEVPLSVTALLSAETLRNSLPRLRHLNISEEYDATTTRSIMKVLFLVSQLTQISHLSMEIRYCNRYGETQEDSQKVLNFIGLKILTIGDTSFFRQEDLSRLHSLKSLHTLNLGLEFWSDLIIPDDLEDLILPDSPLRIPSLKNLNLNTRFECQNIIYGTRWLAQELEDWETAEWNWSGCGDIGEVDLHELFEMAEWSKIKMGGQILEVEWPQFDRPRVLGDV